MSDRPKNKQYYEITKEKPSSLVRMYMVSGSIGSAFGFLIITMIGAYQGVPMDSLVLAFLGASFAGFLLGVVILWFFLRYFINLLNRENLLKDVSIDMRFKTEQQETRSGQENTSDDNNDKGKTIDFTFPEFSPDK